MDLCVWVFYLLVYICAMCVPDTWGGQKKALEPLELSSCDDCELPCRYWEMSPDPLQEQQVL